MFLQKKKIIPFSKFFFFNLKELFYLIISKISSDGGDFPRIIEIALIFVLFFLQQSLLDIIHELAKETQGHV